MRGFIRKAFKINDWIWIITLCFVLVIIYVTFSMPNVDAATRAEVDELKIREKNIRDTIGTVEERISVQKGTIKDHEIIINNLKDDLREAKKQAGSGWEGIKKVVETEKSLNDAFNQARENRNKLIDLLREKSDYIREQKELIHSIDNAVIIHNDYSHLVKKIGVNLSQTCITMIKNNLNSTCPTYKDMISLDSSDTDISGKFTTDGSFFHRDEPNRQQSWRYYDFDDTIRVFIDPPKGMAERIKMIEIQPNFDNYFITDSMEQQSEFELIDVVINATKFKKAVTIQVKNQTQDYGRIIYHDRYVDSCSKAVINADKWEILLADTINYMRNNCDESHTSFIEKEIIHPNYTSIDITTSPNWQFQQEMKRISEFCIFKFRACNS